MADTRRRWRCTCGEFRFEVVDIGVVRCQNHDCGRTWRETGEAMESNFYIPYQGRTEIHWLKM